MTQDQNKAESLEDIALKVCAYLADEYGLPGEGMNTLEGYSKAFALHLLSDPAIPAHVPAYKALQEEVERLKDTKTEAEILGLRFNEPDSFGRIIGFNDRAEKAEKRIADLEAQLSALQAGGEAVGEVVLESMGVPGSDAQIVRFHMYKEIPPVGTKLYTQAPASVQPAIAGKVPDGCWEQAVREIFVGDQYGLSMIRNIEKRANELAANAPTSAIPPGYAVEGQRLERASQLEKELRNLAMIIAGETDIKFDRLDNARALLSAAPSVPVAEKE